VGTKRIRKVDQSVRQGMIEERLSSSVPRIQLGAVCREQPYHLIQTCHPWMKARH
jgi:hypothetical protein